MTLLKHKSVYFNVHYKWANKRLLLPAGFITPYAPVRVRIAPTPSGWLHMGNAINFVLTAAVARACSPDSKVLLRIDDLDAERKRPEYVQDVFETLDWLGIEWDEGPSGPDDFERNWSQHKRIPLYINALEQLIARGLVFGCAKSRRHLAAHEGRYPPEFRADAVPLDTPDAAWRVLAPPDLALSDFVVRRRDGIPAYQIASLCDDLHFNVQKIIRGADLEDSTAAQTWLAQELGWTEWKAVQIWHHPLLTDAAGHKLSKSDGADALRSWRIAGRSPAPIFANAAKWLGINNPPIENMHELAPAIAARFA
jgi:glutamyl/glutaminyl-tRNA synthetase